MSVNIEQVREALSKATGGEWKFDDMCYVWSGQQMLCQIRGWGHMTATLEMSEDEAIAQQDANAHLIANAPEWLRDMADEIEALRAENADLKHFYDFYKKFMDSTQYLGHCNGYTEKQAYNDMRDIAEGDLFKLFDAMEYPEVIAKMRQFFDCEECGGTGIGTPTPEMERNCPECHGYGTTIVKDVAYKNEQYEQFLMREGLQEEFQDFMDCDDGGNDGNE